MRDIQEGSKERVTYLCCRTLATVSPRLLTERTPPCLPSPRLHSLSPVNLWRARVGKNTRCSTVCGFARPGTATSPELTIHCIPVMSLCQYTRFSWGRTAPAEPETHTRDWPQLRSIQESRAARGSACQRPSLSADLPPARSAVDESSISRKQGVTVKQTLAGNPHVLLRAHFAAVHQTLASVVCGVPSRPGHLTLTRAPASTFVRPLFQLSQGPLQPRKELPSRSFTAKVRCQQRTRRRRENTRRSTGWGRESRARGQVVPPYRSV